VAQELAKGASPRVPETVAAATGPGSAENH
jgi:hypothetical protein